MIYAIFVNFLTYSPMLKYNWVWYMVMICISNIFISRCVSWSAVSRYSRYVVYLCTPNFKLTKKCTMRFISLWPCDAIWRHRSGSTLAPKHYLNQCGLLISEVLWQSPEKSIFLKSLPHLPGPMSLSFQVHFLDPNLFYFDSNFSEICFQVSN